MKMSKIILIGYISLFFLSNLCAAEIKKADNSDDLDLGSSWVGLTPPGDADVALWDNTVTGANSAELGANMILDGLKIADPGGLVTIGGTNILSLDGDAALDIDMTGATQDLVIDSRVEMAGSQDYNIAAGRSVVFNASVTNIGERVRMNDGTGTMVIRNDFVITSGTDYEQFGIFNGTVVLDGPDSALDISHRFFFGKNTSASDATLIVSNGTHIARSANNQASANFIGISHGRGDLIMEGGSLSCVYLRAGCNGGEGLAKTNTVIMNGGTLSVSGTTTSAAYSKAFTMGANHVNDAIVDVNQSVRFEMNGGLFETPNGSFQIGSLHPASVSWQGLFLNGGTLAVKRMEIGTAPGIVKEINFNGGLLQLVNVASDGEVINGTSNLTLNVQSGSAFIDSGAMNMTLSQDLLADASSTGGGLIKMGNGSLTLSGDSTYTGLTIVSNGTLKITGSLNTADLLIIPGATFSMADGVISEFTADSFKAGDSLSASTLEFEIASDGLSNDCLVLPSGARLYRVGVKLLQLGTSDVFYKNGSYPILKFTGVPPAIGGLFWDADIPGYKCMFSVDSVNSTVVAEIQYDSAGSAFIWTATGSGNWESASNWSVAPVSGAGGVINFGSSIIADSGVALSSAFTMGELYFVSPFSYTLEGSGSFVFNNSSADALVAVADGSHSVDIPVAVNSGLDLDVSAGSVLTFGAALSGSGAVTLTGSGDVELESASTLSGGIAAGSGRLIVKASDALGAGITDLDGAELRLDGTGPISLANPLVFSAVNSSIASVSESELSGSLSFGPNADYLYKYGSETLTLSGTTVAGAAFLKLSIRDGWVKMADGSSMEINNNRRDAIDLSYNTNNPRGFMVESNAMVQVGGLYTGSGPSNTIHVNGGTLMLTGSGAGGECGLLQTVSDENGTDRLIIDSGSFITEDDDYLSVGVRGGDVEVIVNGGLARFGRFALGVRADSTFGSSPLSNARVYINGGVMECAGFFNWMGDVNSARINKVYLNGGVLRLPATMYSANVINESHFVLNGGSLVLSGIPASTQGSPSLDNYLKGLTDLEVDNGGADIDTAGLDVTITQALVPHGASTGGLIKRGAGSLTLTQPCTYSGPTVVEQGTLAVGGLTATTGLTLYANVTLSLVNDSYDDIALTTLNLGNSARIELETSPDSSESDQISIASGATVGDIIIALYDKGTRNSATRSDTFAIFDYAGTPPDVSGWSLSDDNYGITCVFVTNTANSTIDAVLSYTSAEVAWAGTGSGDWSTAGNWWPTAPAASGASVMFGAALISNSVVNVDSPVSVGAIIFDHSYIYTLSGSVVTLDNPVGDASIDVLSGTHQLNSSLTLNDMTLVDIVDGAELVVSGLASGSGSLTVDGGGQLSLSGTNSVPTTLQGGTTLSVSSEGGYASSSLTLNGGILQVGLSDTLGCGIALGVQGGSLASADGSTLTINQDLTGSGGLAKIDGGTVDVAAGVLKYSGATASQGGTLRLAELPSGDLELGGATLDLQSSIGSTTNALVIDSGSHGAVLDIDGSVTISGLVTNVSGSMLKFGSGSVTFAGALNDFGANEATLLDASAAPATNGDGPTVGYAGLSVANGKAILGAPGQTNTMGKLYVGIETTDQPSAETAGEVEIVDGVTTCSDISLIGRRNGSSVTAPAGLISKLKVSGGEISIYGLIMGTAPDTGTATARPVLQVNSGLCTVSREFELSHSAGIVATVEVNGGTLVHQAESSFSMRIGQGPGTGILRVNGGLADLRALIMAYGGVGSTGIVEVTGGVLQFSGIYNIYGGYGRMLVDGGTLRPSGTVSSLDLFEVGANPLTLDTSMADTCSFSQPLTGAVPSDGGLIITGGNALKLNAQPTYNGPTIVSNGTLRTAVDTSVASDVIILPNGTLDLTDEPDRLLNVPSLALGASGDSGSANVVFEFNGDGGSNDVINVAGALTLYNAAFSLNIGGTELNMFPDGTYNLIYYSGADPVTSGLTCANPRYGKDYIFSASGGVLSVTIGNATSGAHIWTFTGSGSWDTAGNWLVAPGAGSAGTEVRLDSAIIADSTITLGQAVTLGAMHFNHTNQYTVSGVQSITLDSSSGNALLAVEQGDHILDAPVVLNDTLDVRTLSGTQLDIQNDISGNGSLVKHHGGVLNLTGQNSYTGSTDVTFGMLRLDYNATLGDGDLILSSYSASLGIASTFSSSLDNDVQMNDNRGTFTVTGALELSGELNWNGPSMLYKNGPGTLTLSGTSSVSATNINNSIRLSEGTLVFADGAEYHLNYAQREAFDFIDQNLYRRKVVFENGSYVKAGGIYTRYGSENRFTVEGRVDFVDDYDAIALRASTATQDYIDYFTINESGYVTAAEGSWVDVGVRGPAIFTVDGGRADLSRFSLGYQSGFELNSKGGHAVVKNGGVLNIQGELNWMGDTYTLRCNSLTVEGSGSVLRMPATRSVNITGRSAFGINGGTFEATGVNSYGGTLSDYLASLDVLHFGTKGGAIDTDSDITITQAVASESSTNAVLTKAGSGTLVLSSALNWAGGIHVENGALVAELDADEGVIDPTNIFYRANFECGPNQDTSGNARHGLMFGSEINLGTTGPQSDHGLLLNGNTCLRVPFDAEMIGVTRYTVAGWIWLDAYSGNYTEQTFFTTRLSGGTHGPDETMFRIVDGKIRFMYGSNGTVGGWKTGYSSAATIPKGQWVHFAVVADVDNVKFYFNGQYDSTLSFPGYTLTLAPDRTGSYAFGIALGCYSLSETSGMFKGRLDDIRVYTRTLAEPEIAAMVGSADKYPDLHVSSGATFVAEGSSQVDLLSGEGFVAGELTVNRAVAPGETAMSVAGAALSVETLNLASNTLFDCTWSANYSDVIVVDDLNIAGSGVVDLGRDSGNPIPNGSFRTVLMYYDTISGDVNLNDWTLINAGVSAGGLEYDIFAENGEVVLTITNLRGTVLILR